MIQHRDEVRRDSIGICIESITAYLVSKEPGLRSKQKIRLKVWTLFVIEIRTQECFPDGQLMLCANLDHEIAMTLSHGILQSI